MNRELEVRHCRTLVAVNDHGGIAAAARALGVAQSTVSGDSFVSGTGIEHARHRTAPRPGGGFDGCGRGPASACASADRGFRNSARRGNSEKPGRPSAGNGGIDQFLPSAQAVAEFPATLARRRHTDHDRPVRRPAHARSTVRTRCGADDRGSGPCRRRRRTKPGAFAGATSARRVAVQSSCRQRGQPRRFGAMYVPARGFPWRIQWASSVLVRGSGPRPEIRNLRAASTA